MKLMFATSKTVYFEFFRNRSLRGRIRRKEIKRRRRGTLGERRNGVPQPLHRTSTKFMKWKLLNFKII